ncbi:hypothetical protein VUR80DRAFT_9313 [Thermomyces stellatus]
MRAFTFLTLGLASLGLASCSPSNNGGDDSNGGDHGQCISRAEAGELAQAYAALIGAFKETDAEHWLADDFIEHSDSINTFINKPLGSMTFDKASFIANQASGELPPTPVTVVGEPLVECNRVVILWSSTFGKGWPAKGVTVVEVKKNGDKDGRSKWLMKRWDVEFNSLAWAYDMGQYYCLFGKGFGEVSACGAPKARGLE